MAAPSALQALQGGGGGLSLQGGNPINLQGSNFNPQQTAPASVLNSGANILGQNQGSVLGASTSAPASSSGANSSGINSPAFLQGLQNEYGSSIANAQRQIPFYQNFMNTLSGAATNQAGQQQANENNVFNANNNAYETQKQGIGNQQKLSLAELADQIHGQNAGLTHQLGTLGAGSSSAMETGQRALANVQNTNRADIQQQAGVGSANISAAQQALLSQHQSNLDQISQFKTNTLSNIIGYYTPLIQNLQTAAQNAQGAQERLAAQYGLKTLSSEATGALANLDSAVAALSQKSLASLNA